MYAVVADVEAYPRFLNWCHEVQVLQREITAEDVPQEVVTAKMRVAYAKLNFSFTTRNAHRKGESIRLGLHDGPFSTFTGEWRFVPLGDSGCKTSFEMEFMFERSFGAGLMEKIFEKIASSQLDRFQQRAKTLYQTNSLPGAVKPVQSPLR
jgi:ribosome-associated toxin RatA of RatAB toxin-antitoxin module